MGEQSAGLELLAKRVATMQTRERTGTLARLLEHHALLDSAKEVLATADTLIDYLTNGNGTVGRLRSDSALRRARMDARVALDSLRLRITREEGTAGRILDDDALRRDLEELHGSSRALRPTWGSDRRATRRSEPRYREEDPAGVKVRSRARSQATPGGGRFAPSGRRARSTSG